MSLIAHFCILWPAKLDPKMLFAKGSNRPEADAPRTPWQESTVFGVQSQLKRVPSKVTADSLRVCKHVFFGFLVDDITKRLEDRGGIGVFFAIGKIEFVIEVRWVLALIVLEHCFQLV